MPGKVNPVMSEMLIQVCTQVIGNDLAVTLGARDSVFQLNVMMPLIARNLLESIRLLSNAVNVFTERCVAGLEAKRGTLRADDRAVAGNVYEPRPGHRLRPGGKAIAKEASATGQTVRQVALAKKVLSPAELEKLLNPATMTAPTESA